MIVTNSLTGGGAERSMNILSNELIKLDFVVSLVPVNAGESDKVTPACEVFPLNRSRKTNIVGIFVAIWKFNKLVRSWKPDIVILNCDLPELLGALLQGRHSIIVVEHSSIPWIQREAIGKCARRILSFRDARWIAVSSHLRIWPNQNIPSSIIPNPVATNAEIRALPISSEVERLVFIGRLSSEKRPDFLIDIALLTRIPTLMIGAGSMRESLETKVQAHSLDVVFTGQAEDPWILTRSGDLLIAPSEFEGDGLVVIEGLQRKMPMLLADIPDFRRFNFPEANYCKKIEDFAERIQDYRHDLSSLKIPFERAEEILLPRAISTVGRSWMDFLNSV